MTKLWSGALPSTTSVHCIQTNVNVIGSRQQLLQCAEVKDAPQHFSIGLHRVHNLHCVKQTQEQNSEICCSREGIVWLTGVWMSHYEIVNLLCMLIYPWRAWKCPLQMSACWFWTDPLSALGRCDTPADFCWSQIFCLWCLLEQDLRDKVRKGTLQVTLYQVRMLI